jgi:hypothetical protein
MDDETERPGLFNMWPSVTYINCPNCGTHWPEPRFGSDDAIFPPIESENETRESLDRVYCPRCGELLPSIHELASKDCVVGRPPILGKPFIGTISGIRRLLERSRGADTQLWQYFVSHSNLILKIDSTKDKTHAFVVCSMTKTVVLPKLYWKSSFVLESTEHQDDWALRDEPAGAEIVCSAIGIFHELNQLW